MAERIEKEKRSKDQNSLVFAAALQSLCVVLCAQTFMSGGAFHPEKLIAGWVSAGDVLLSVLIWTGCFWLSLRFAAVRKWLLSGSLLVLFVVTAVCGGGPGLAAALLFLAYAALPEEIKRRTQGERTAAQTEQRVSCKQDWSRRKLFLTAGAGAAAFLLAAGGITAFRYLEFRSPGFDFGIFTQMFEQMRTTGLPLTTCERGRSLSHFAVHFSPALYFLLPVYTLFPHPLTLVVLQVLGLALGALPFGGLCRFFGLSRRTTGWMILAFLAYPALAGGCFYDFHENFLLTPFLLSFLYLAHTRRLKGAALTALCVLLVKEDAAIYLLCVSVYLAVRPGAAGRERLFFTGIAAFSIVYFFAAVAYVSSQGLGTLATVHYSQYETGEGGFANLVFNILQNPLHVLWVAFRQEKWLYLMQMFLPLLFLPLIGLKKTQLILLAPMLLLNLMTDYSYQYNIDFQYQFGTLVFLFYLTIQAVAGFRREQVRTLLGGFMAAVSLLLAVSFHSGRTIYLERWLQNRESYGKMEEILGEVRRETKDGGQTVAASAMLLAHLWTVEELYNIDQREDADQIVLDLRYKENRELAEEYQADGYRVRRELPGFVIWLSGPAAEGNGE